MNTKPLDLVHAFIWTFGVIVVLSAGFGVAATWTAGLVRHPGFVGGWVAAVYAGGALGVRRLHLEPGSSVAALGVRATAPSLFAFAALLGVMVHVPVATLARFNEIWSPAPAALAAERIAVAGAGPGARLMLGLFLLGGLAPICQELFFRGGLYRGLCRTSGPRAAALVVGLCSVIANPDIRGWLPQSMLAGLLSYLRLSSGSVLPSIGLHVVYGTTLIYLDYLGLMGTESILGLNAAWVVSGWIGAAALTYRVYRVAKGSPECALARAEDGR